ncbi:MAG: NAD(P)/FAD-dependent oxidoreductase [Chloroflexi bacterium]|nr:NAD(P)/FAD-dependent oxidoreductase [Chloroflexota bacterium]
MAKKYDAIIIGAGHNGLINAAYLARAGKKVLVLERRHLVGGATVTEEIFPGFKFSVFSYVVSLLRPQIIQELQLPRFGLTILPLESTLTPLPNGDYLYRDSDHYRSLRDIARHSARDAEAYEEYNREMYFMAKAAQPIIDNPAPDPASLKPGELFRLARLGKNMLNMGPERLYTLAKLLTMSAADFVEQWFEAEPLIATLSASGIIGTNMGPRSPGTAYVLLHHYMGDIDGAFRAWGFPKGGTGAVAEAIARSARAFGAEIRCEAAVERVIIRNGRARGVVLNSGEEITCNVVVSSLDPKQTFLKLVDPALMPEELVQDIRRFNIRGSSAKVNLALDALPEFSCMPGKGNHLRGAISISPSLDYMERAYDDAKYGNIPRRPYIDIIIPSMIDPDMAPPGKHVMSCFVQWAPYELNQGTWDERREELGDNVIDTLEEYIPNIKSIILGRQVLSPWDIEQMTGLSEGNIFQGELTLSQLLFLRPAPGYARYRTPIHNYYQCGSGTHPGGGIMGASGRFAAMAILRSR